MKNVLGAIFTLSLLTACSSPVLKWIDTPLGGVGGRITGQDWDKEIVAFDFPDITGEDIIIGGEPQPDGKYPIVAVIPSSAGSLAAEIPAISYRGTSISPGLTTVENFSNPLSPVTYTVTAEDRTTRDYVVKVVIKEDDGYGKQITGFFFTNPLIEGVIDEPSHTIALTVPWGTDLSAQRPEVFYTGASLYPLSGRPADFSAAAVSPPSADKTGITPVKYTVRDQGGLSQSYNVYVFPVDTPILPVISVPDAPDAKVDAGTSTEVNGSYNTSVVVEYPVHIENPVFNINYPGAGNTVNIGSIDRSKNTNLSSNVFLENNTVNVNNTDIVNYIPIQIDNGEYMYVLAVNPPEETSTPPTPGSEAEKAASIDGFYFTNPVAIGTINQDDRTITVTVPYGTNTRNLMPVIYYTGKAIVNNPGSNPITGHANSFTSPVVYTVLAHDDSTTKDYTVTVNVAPNTAKEITAFTFTGFDNPADIHTIISGAPNAEGKYPIEITIPAGQSPAALTPAITHTGQSISPVTDATPKDFSLAVDYTVKAQDGTEKTYTVTVRNAVPLEENIEITGFYFTNPLAVGTVNQYANTITVAVPSRTNTANLAPMVYFRGMMVRPGSGAANDFSGPVVYTVTGRNGKTRPYTVMVNNILSGSRDITRFDLGIENSETIIGAVPDTNGNYPIAVWVPTGTELAGLSPNIAHTGVDIDPPAGISQDFSGPGSVNYTVTAEDGTEKTYTVSVNFRNNNIKIITSFIFNDIPLAGGGTLRVVAGINQDDHTITATVPHAADISSLRPVITYLGRSVAEPAGGDKTTNPFTGTARNFGVSQTYTVKDQGGGTQAYTVRVIKQSPIATRFEGEADRAIIASNNFDQNTGVITITVNTGNAAGPYEWYVDGVMQAVSATETVFTLNVGTGNFTPGRHEILLSGIQNGLHYTGRVYFSVTGGSK